jgi:hypothetical protein
VLESLSEYVLLPEVLNQLQEAIRASRDESTTQIDEQRRELSNSLAGLRRRIAHLTEAITESGHTRALLEKLAGLESDETINMARLAELDPHAEAPTPDLADDQLIHMAEHFPNILLEGDLQTLQAILRGFVEKIMVDRNKNIIMGVITYYLPLASIAKNGSGGPGSIISDKVLNG